jgi:hypothetical protein
MTSAVGGMEKVDHANTVSAGKATRSAIPLTLPQAA